MQVSKVSVLGAGIMGAGIAQVAAQSGLQVNMRDIDDKFLEKGMSTIKQSLGRIVKKEKMTQSEADAVVARIKCTKDLIEAVKDVDVVIEAIPENMALKKETYARIDAACPEKVIFASNTSGLSITDMASDTTRLIGVLQNEAIHCFAEGIASAEDIDKSMKLGMNHPMGPLQLADFVGLDTLLSCMDNLYKEYGDPKYPPPLLVRQMVRAGHLGRKTGKGFYDYTEQK